MKKLVINVLAVAVIAIGVNSCGGGNSESVMTMTTQSKEVLFCVHGTGTFTIDWGDGEVMEGMLDDWSGTFESWYTHKYTGIPHNITITGKITHFCCAGGQSINGHSVSNELILVLDVSRNPYLTMLYCHNNDISTLDVSKNTNLTELFCSLNQLYRLDVSNNKKLKELIYDEHRVELIASAEQKKRFQERQQEREREWEQERRLQRQESPFSDEIIPYHIVEIKPLFNGKDADKEFLEWVTGNIVYPPAAKKNGITGRVIIEFLIDTDGNVTDIKILRSVDPLLDAELMRVVRTSPKWTPGMHYEQLVNVKYQFPYTFLLQ